MVCVPLCQVLFFQKFVGHELHVCILEVSKKFGDWNVNGFCGKVPDIKKV